MIADRKSPRPLQKNNKLKKFPSSFEIPSIHDRRKSQLALFDMPVHDSQMLVLGLTDHRPSIIDGKSQHHWIYEMQIMLKKKKWKCSRALSNAPRAFVGRGGREGGGSDEQQHWEMGDKMSWNRGSGVEGQIDKTSNEKKEEKKKKKKKKKRDSFEIGLEIDTSLSPSHSLPKFICVGCGR